MKLTKNEWIAGIGTLIVMVLLTLFMLYFGLSANIPLTEEGLTVSFGDVALSSGWDESVPAPNESTAPSPSEPADNPLLTQNDESVFLDAEARQQAEEEARRKKEEERRKEQEAKAAQIQSQVANVFNVSRTENAGNKGEGDTPAGTQGQADGVTQTPNLSGAGEGFASFSLNGRSLNGGLPRPVYSIEEEGIVVVRIVVNSQGVVLSADTEINGTTTSNPQLRNAAEQAARQTRFNPISGNQNQTGTITYRFLLR